MDSDQSQRSAAWQAKDSLIRCIAYGRVIWRVRLALMYSAVYSDQSQSSAAWQTKDSCSVRVSEVELSILPRGVFIFMLACQCYGSILLDN